MTHLSKPCGGGMASHARGAARRGATGAEVADARGVVTFVNGGTGTVHAPRALQAFRAFQELAQQ